jgi:hypothetical protein
MKMQLRSCTRQLSRHAVAWSPLTGWPMTVKL